MRLALHSLSDASARRDARSDLACSARSTTASTSSRYSRALGILSVQQAKLVTRAFAHMRLFDALLDDGLRLDERMLAERVGWALHL